MAMLQLRGWLMIVVTIFCAIRTYRDLVSGNTAWAIVSLVITIAAIVVITIPVPTHAVRIDLPR